MIERLRTSLRTLSTLTPTELMAPASERLRGDCADALRLELDCPQQALTPSQRSAFSHLNALLEEPTALPDVLASAVRGAGRAIA